MYLAKIHVNYKRSILNPEAQAVQTALLRLGYQDVASVKLGKYFELKLTNAQSKEQAAKEVDEICDRLLANVNMESYYYQLEELVVAE
ncbi:phosphoribosylformylglycinamidine synthase subunit PurS [Loigolactobacillus backii]|uniref:Phosphoribosylformylglycinamidine synthase subunit PurS n=1 Tax=Loigolactobacillus backii TaxID=375175 RepID=A0A192H0I3_9LACO|nr:phosphoribosylformylglycinamidine synthase subunit PurS [Loigolactobacillus backii]ANK61752.1 phosphoribosylformylglycinamidine synthase [Loigolactobacillus backii]ANK69054.1 phosphoribosylformylglycinamidine synthase [Loigolactobacillus backii]MDA5387217.1 phosphoribosylformylglycinamidine synthase subunit PurS [Loigolactobacillus backii]MDA5389709.1 phosphoribosylformylglycinamidine synthase subunit PurS [Loigolactobacillus backii]PIO82271.1 phosphoribosylformylglycinamidine synthase [Loi